MTWLSEKRIKKFQKLLKEEYGEEYTHEEAREAATNLVGFFDLLLKMDSKIKKTGINNVLSIKISSE